MMDGCGSACAPTFSAFFELPRRAALLLADSLQKQQEAQVVGGRLKPRGIAAPTVIPVKGRRHCEEPLATKQSRSEGAQRPEIASPRNDRQGRPSEGRN